ncbi:MAG: hypothetical protein KR126chlam3_00756 [Chlamydiae bacterium]|nr:hypothetical protein [Chlamydiota bacterium]
MPGSGLRGPSLPQFQFLAEQDIFHLDSARKHPQDVCSYQTIAGIKPEA